MGRGVIVVFFISTCFAFNEAELQVECEVGQFRCQDGRKCIRAEDFCNFVADCADYSDEIRFDASELTPGDGIYCRSYASFQLYCFLPIEYKDQKDVFCSNGPEDKCREGYYHCKSTRKCISKYAFCDGWDICTRGKMEILYDPEKHTERDGTPCRSWSNMDKICLLPRGQDPDDICNKESDCPPDMYMCATEKSCIPKRKFCDGTVNCNDGSDEVPADGSVLSGETVECKGWSYLEPTCKLYLSNGKNDPAVLCNEKGTCSEDEFKCPLEEKCIHKRAFCNGVNDCIDGADEVLYDSGLHTSEEGFKCHQHFHSQICLLPKEYDPSSFCFITNLHCNSDMFICADGLQCIGKTLVCDGLQQCRDGSDEIMFDESIHDTRDVTPCRSWINIAKVCLMPNKYADRQSQVCNIESSCGYDHFKCSNGEECIETDLFCDGTIHCSDGSDEINYNNETHSMRDGIPCLRNSRACLIPSKYEQSYRVCRAAFNCKDDQYLCKNNYECIYEGWFCDGEPQCADGSDEIIYNASIHDPQLGFPCKRHEPGLTCVLESNRIKNHEEFCISEVKCEKDSCHSDADCSDGDGVIICTCKEGFEGDGKNCERTGCPAKFFKCWDGECIPRVKFCDQHQDCRDGEDEDRETIGCRGWRQLRRKCTLPSDQDEDSICNIGLNCEEGEYRCRDGQQCIPAAKFCNGRRDCMDGSDELSARGRRRGKGFPCTSLLTRKLCLLPCKHNQLVFANNCIGKYYC